MKPTIKEFQSYHYPFIHGYTDDKPGGVEVRVCDRCGAREKEVLKPDRANPKFADATGTMAFLRAHLHCK